MTPIQQAIAILEEDALTNRIERALEVLRGVPQSPSLPVAWIAFSDNGNVRFWTSDPHRSQREKERGLDLRAFTMAELIALISRIPEPSAASPDTRPVREGKCRRCGCKLLPNEMIVCATCYATPDTSQLRPQGE